MSDAGSDPPCDNKNGCGRGLASDRLDRLLDVVADQQRRNVLYALQDIDASAITLDELVTEISLHDSQSSEKQIVSTLHHTDLPKLREIGILDYDPRTNTIRVRDEDTIQDLVQYLKEIE